MKRKRTSRKEVESLPPSEVEEEQEDAGLDAQAVQAQLAAGGGKRGEPLKVIEEEDDFEDGRSSGGRQSRAEYDEWTRGDVGSRSSDTHSGVLSVEGERDDREFHAARRTTPEQAEPEEPVVEPVEERADYSALEYEGLRGEQKTFDFRKSGGTRSGSPKRRSRKSPAKQAAVPPPSPEPPHAPGASA